MSQYQIPTIADEDLDLAISAEIGAESRVFVSFVDGKLVGELEQDVADDATLVLDRAYRPPTVTTGRDMQLVCNEAVRSDEQLVVVLNVLLGNVTPAPKTISANTLASPTVVTTTAPHGLTSGQSVTISASNSTPVIDGARVVTVISPTTFSVPVNVTTAGTAGTVQGPVGTANGIATATFSPPELAQDQSFNFPPGLGVDIKPADLANTIVSVISVESVDGGKPGNKFYLLALPQSSDFVEVMCSVDKNYGIPAGKSIAIPCRFNGARWVKKGRSEAPNLEITGKYASFGDGLARINGARVTVKIETRKDDRILTERLTFSGWRPVVTFKKGDGDAEAEATATGMYEIFAGFV